MRPQRLSVFQKTPYFQRIGGMQDLINWYYKNPIFYSIVMVKARCDANRRYVIKKRGTEDIEKETTRKTIPGKLYRLLNRPNILESGWEFRMKKKVFEEVTGNSMVYGNVPVGFKNKFEYLSSLWNCWPQYMQIKLTGQYFDATKISDIISGWRFEYGTYRRDFASEDVMLRNKPAIDPMDGLVLGRATAYSQTRPLSNIDMAYESRNSVMANRGMDVILSSGKEDDNGPVPLLHEEHDEIKKAIKGYGALEDQEWAFFSSLPLNVTPINRDVRKLGLFEEIATDTIALCHAWGVPEILVKLYLQGATFENQEASLRALYQNTLIPESEDDDVELNSFLGLDDTEWCIASSFDHIACLQMAKQVKATANSLTSTYMERLFMLGMVTMNQWLAELDLPSVDGLGDKRLPEMDEEDMKFILTMLGKPMPGEEPAQIPGQEGQPGQQAPAAEETEDEKEMARIVKMYVQGQRKQA